MTQTKDAGAVREISTLQAVLRRVACPHGALLVTFRHILQNVVRLDHFTPEDFDESVREYERWLRPAD